ncbi:MAG: ferrochelatase [Planctomycetota bacterium]
MPDSPELPPVDSFLLVSFGGPEGPDDVMPFLENVLRGKPVPRERMLEVAEHYKHFGGVSPINDQNRQLMTAIESELRRREIDLPMYWGNRNWHPLLPDTIGQMAKDGRKRAIAFFTSMFSCYSGCRQYRENIADAQEAVGPDAPIVQKVRMGFNHPKFVDVMAGCVTKATNALVAESLDGNADRVTLMFTAHSIPMSMADHCDYEKQLREASRLVAEAAGIENWKLVFQSRSGPPTQPWLEPDVCDEIESMHQSGFRGGLVILPIGFVSDHMEVMYDLDEEALELCQKLNIPMTRAATAGTHQMFVEMIVDLIQERIEAKPDREAVGELGPWHDACPLGCCKYEPKRPPARPDD